MNIRDLLNHWGGGQLLAYSGVDGDTDFFHGLTLRTTNQGIGLEVKLPGTLVTKFPDDSRCDWLTSDCFKLTSVRGVLLDAYHLLIEGPCECGAIDKRLRVIRDGHRTLIGSRYGFNADMIHADIEKAMHDRLAWLRQATAPATPTMAKAFSQMKGMIYSAEGQIKRRFTTPDRWPHRGMWLWDSAFHAIGYRHVDTALAREILSAVFDCQREDGFVPIRSDPDFSHNHFTQPPVLALAAALVNQKDPHRDWLAWIYPRLAAYVKWDLANRDSDGAGLLEWMIEENVNCRSGESGMDNSTRFDAATRMDATDFNSFIASECEVLSELAGILGFIGEARHWRMEHDRMCRLIGQRLWSDRHQFFVDYDLDRGCQSDVLASSGFLPLICGAATPEQARLLREHLRNPATFGSPLPVPSVAANNPGYAKDMWRGPVWVNLNWLIAHGFERYGYHDDAGRIREETLAEIERQHRQYGTLFEFFDDRREVPPPQLLRKGRLAPEVSFYHQVFHDYGWTATLYVDLALQSQAR